tara:strand:+ start:1783 stop:2325 length:543 start_codon:yes stop_codon:yes gene_type:complete
MATPTTLPAAFVSGNVLTAAQLNDLRGAFRVLQVVQTQKTDTFTMTSSTLADITGFSATITPSSTSSLVLVISVLSLGANDGSTQGVTQLLRGSTAIAQGDTAGSRLRRTNYFSGTSFSAPTETTIWLDSPASASALTYKMQIASLVNGQTVAVNRSIQDSDNTTTARSVSSLTLMEISA